MKTFFCTLALFVWSTCVVAQPGIENTVKIDHSWVQGSYWSPSQYPGWGVLVDVQDLTMFGAVYGYMGNDPSFVVFVGTATTIDPLIFSGDVYFVIEPGVEEEIVGTFTWETTQSRADPAARFSISSNILNVSNLPLIRFAYGDVDDVDTITGGDWSIVRRVLGLSFADHYAITDIRVQDEGITYAGVVDLSDEEMLGVVGYFPPEQGDIYGMLVQFDEDSNLFYLFYANNGNMFGRYWLLDTGQSPTGDGSFFRGVSDTLQSANYVGGGDPTASIQSSSRPPVVVNSTVRAQLRSLETSTHQNVTKGVEKNAPQVERLNAYRRLIDHMQKNAR